MELILEDAIVVTMANDRGEARALLIRDGRVAAVGSSEEVRAAAGPGAAVVRLQGATVVPGLVDAHCHVGAAGYIAAAADCGQPSAPDFSSIQARLREAADRTPQGSWVTGCGYLEYELQEGRHPTRSDLDGAVGNRPAVLIHKSLHVCVLNSAALLETGLMDGQPDPPGGALGRDLDGRLNGVVYEAPMFALFEQQIRQHIATMGRAERARFIGGIGRSFAELGVTSAGDAARKIR